VSFLENNGDDDASTFDLLTMDLFGEDLGWIAAPFCADFDGDGDHDCLVGARDGGKVVYYENMRDSHVGPVDALPHFLQSSNDYFDWNVGADAAPTCADVNGDGLLDCLVGNNSGHVHLFINEGSTTAPSFSLFSSDIFSSGGQGIEKAMPTCGDLDGDGDADCLLGHRNGFLHYFENTGGFPISGLATTEPSFESTLAPGSSQPTLSPSVQVTSAPTNAEGSAEDDDNIDAIDDSSGTNGTSVGGDEQSASSHSIRESSKADGAAFASVGVALAVVLLILLCCGYVAYHRQMKQMRARLSTVNEDRIEMSRDVSSSLGSMVAAAWGMDEGARRRSSGSSRAGNRKDIAGKFESLEEMDPVLGFMEDDDGDGGSGSGGGGDDDESDKGMHDFKRRRKLTTSAASVQRNPILRQDGTSDPRVETFLQAAKLDPIKVVLRLQELGVSTLEEMVNNEIVTDSVLLSIELSRLEIKRYRRAAIEVNSDWDEDDYDTIDFRSNQKKSGSYMKPRKQQQSKRTEEEIARTSPSASNSQKASENDDDEMLNL
jgi:hypothetical protein